MHLQRKCTCYHQFRKFNNSELLSVNNWLDANKLTLNALNSIALIFPPKTRQQATNLKITIDSCKAFAVNSVKYFRVFLYNKLIFGSLITYVLSKLSLFNCNKI